MGEEDFLKSIVDGIFYLIFPFVFSLLVIPDTVKAFKKRASWVPGNALALSALTIQAISFFSFSHVFISFVKDELFEFLDYQVIIDFGRLNTCVFIGYVLPEIESSQSAKTLKLILALVISVVGQIFSELYYLYSNNEDSSGHEKDLFWFSLSSNILYLSMIFLIFTLVCTVIAGKTLRGNLNKRIAAIVSVDEVEGSQIISPCAEDDPKYHSSEDRAWKDFENEVFKSWILGRVCQPDYVIARSALSSAVGLVVTICVMLCFFKSVWLAEHYHNKHFYPFYEDNPLNWLFFCSTWPFIMVGWVIICWRWFATLFYFSKLKVRGGIWILFRIEEFWTRRIVEVINVWELKGFHVDPQSRANCLSRIVVKIRLYKLLYIVKAIQIFLVLVSKSCQLLSEMLLSTPFIFIMNWLLSAPFLSTFHGQQTDSTSACYKEFAFMLKRVCMPGEDPASLWEANVSAIKQIELFMEEGRKKGRQCENLIAHSNEFSQQWIEDGFGLIDELRQERLPRVHNYFPHLDKPCLKMTAVSLLYIIIRLERNKPDRVNTAVKACREAWDVMTLVDNARVGDQMLNLIGNIGGSDGSGSDIASAYEVHVSIAADKEFSRLQTLSEQLPNCSVGGESGGVASINVDVSSQRDQCMQMRSEAAAALKISKLLVDENHKEKNETEIEGEMATRGQDNEETDADFELRDAIDWMKIAPQYSLYRLCRVIDGLGEWTEPDLVCWAENSLRNIVACCLSRLPDMLVKFSRQCAQEFDEDNLWKAIYLAGKARGLMEKLGVPRMKPREQLIEMEWRLS